MAGNILTMTEALKSMEKTGKVSKMTKDGAFRLTLTRQPDRQDEGQYLLQFFRLPRKSAPKTEQTEQEELALRYDTLQRALLVINQALAGGLDTLLMFNKPPSAEA